MLGDPSLHIWKDTPRNVIVNYTGSIPIGPSAVQVSVIDAATSEPISDALVCISANDTYVDAFTLANGTATINVNTQSIELLNITVSGKNIIPFEGTIQVSDIQTFPLSVYIANGWNLVSVPGINSEGQGIYHWWSHLTGSVFRFIPGTGYSEITTTTPGQGYWMKNNGENIYNTGDEWPSGGIQIATHSPINLSQSWNIFGGFEDIVDAGSLNTTPPEQILFPIYKYVPGTGYQPATQIIPGYGYWIKMQSACQLNIPNVSMVVSNKDSEYLKDYLPENKTGWGKLIFTDANGKSYTLYTADNNSDLSKYELPPLPPYGVFDIRFGSGRIAEDLSSSQSVLLSGIEYPLKVRSENIYF